MSSAVPTEARHNIIIDTDVGSDDALAIACALTEDPAVLKVCAITTLFGNMPNEQVATNVATILKVFGKADIPFYSGSSSPLASQQLPEPWLGHGSNGLGGSEFSAEIAAAVGAGGDVSLPRRSPEPAVHALIRMARERPGFYEILAIGPLTNLALACKVSSGHMPSRARTSTCCPQSWGRPLISAYPARRAPASWQADATFASPRTPIRALNISSLSRLPRASPRRSTPTSRRTSSDWFGWEGAPPARGTRRSALNSTRMLTQMLQQWSSRRGRLAG